jgi:PAS domain S-box-containing protein
LGHDDFIFGKRLWFREESETMSFEDPGASRVAGIAEKKAEHGHGQQKEAHSLLLDTMQTLVWYLTEPQVSAAVNRATAEFFGLSKDRMENQSVYGILDPEEADTWVSGNLEVFRTKEQKRTEEWWKNASGEPRLLAVTRTPKLDEQGNVCFVVCSAEDITERKQAEEALRETTARFEALLEALPDVIYFKGIDRRYWMVNKAFEEITGKDRRDIVGKTPEEVFPADVAVPFRESDEQVIRSAKSALSEQQFALDQGKDIVLETIKFPVVDHSGHVIAVGGTSRDITKRKVVEQAIVRAKEEWERTFDAVPDLIAIIDEHHRIVRLNRAMVEKLELTFQEAVGKPCYEIMHNTAAPPHYCPHARLLSDGQPHSVEVYEPTLAGAFLISASPIRDSTGTLKGCVHIARDVTERRKAERLVIQTERLKALADLASGAAHNFNNLLQIIMGNAHLALSNLETGELSEMETDLEAILSSCHFGAETVRRLQDFARTRSETLMEATTFDLSDLVEQAVEMSKPWWKSGPEKEGFRIDLTQNLTKGCLVTGKKSELFEVVVNLIKNAVEALPHGGTIWIDTLKQAGRVLLRVRDNGMGIPKNRLRKVFEPFFTTKGSGGTGMGLASSFGIVQAHGGEMTAQSHEGKGTIFTVSLLRATAGSDDSAVPVIQGTLKWRILIIDDQWPIVELLRQGLTQFGPEVLAALSGGEGVRIFQAEPVDLVICDLGMPGMSGWEVGKRVQEICTERGVAKTPFILLTGWGDRGRETGRLDDSAVDAIIEKPADLRKLIAVARQLIDRRPLAESRDTDIKAT